MFSFFYNIKFFIYNWWKNQLTWNHVYFFVNQFWIWLKKIVFNHKCKFICTEMFKSKWWNNLLSMFITTFANIYINSSKYHYKCDLYTCDSDITTWWYPWKTQITWWDPIGFILLDEILLTAHRQRCSSSTSYTIVYPSLDDE